MKAWDIAGYTYRADTYCPRCVLGALPTGDGERYDGWQDMTGRMSTEENLSELATAFGIDRDDENSFDSGDFPKVVFASQVENETCSVCGTEL